MIEIKSFFPARQSGARWRKLLTRRTSKTYDRQYYDAANGTYGGYRYDGRYHDSVSSLVHYFRIEPPATILEIGCAKGFVLVEFQKLGFKVLGFDASLYAVLTAHPEVYDHVRCWRLPPYPVENRSMGLVVCKEVLPHLNEAEIWLMLAEIRRVAAFPNRAYLEIQCADTWLGRLAMKLWDPTHRTIRSESWWRALLRDFNYHGVVHFKHLF
jgi:SAM-dependent methyltransferase